MKNNSLQGYNSRYITLKCDGSAKPGDLVVMSENNTVKKAVSGKFMGVLHSLRGEYGLVQTGGFVVLHYSGIDPEVGFQNIAADASGDGVKSDSGREVLVIEVDPSAKNAGILF